MIAWRNAHTPGKEIWVTAFGYDASTKPAPPDSKWVGATDTEQAQWLVRSFLVFSAMDIDEASFFYFDDDDLPGLHNSSGITRHFQPKPSFYALAHLQKTLGDYRFSKVINSDKNLYVYEYVNPDKPGEPIWVAWSPTGSQREDTQKISITGKAIKAERMPLKEGDAEAVNLKDDGGAVEFTINESPTYIWLKQ